ncbi:hypothetical protein [Bacillus sp. V5-8f]|nr:hypothetical protein [Bacillus sp. V5-8f]
MARLPEGKQKLSVGCYYTMNPSKGLAFDLLRNFIQGVKPVYCTEGLI